jgi:hypothetical protein
MGFNLSQIVNESLNTKNVSEIITSKNLFDKSAAEEGIITASTGNTSASTGWYRSAYTELYDNRKNPEYLAFSDIANSTVAGIAFFDSSKAFISGIISAVTFSSALIILSDIELKLLLIKECISISLSA